MSDYNLIKTTVITILGLYLLCCIIIGLYNYLKTKETSFSIIIEAVIIIIILSLITVNETLSVFTAIGLSTLFIKTILSMKQIIDFKNDSDSYVNNFIQNLFFIINYKKLDSMILLKKYLPIAILNGFLMIVLYLYTITKLRVDLSLASNCLNSNFTVEYATVRNKVCTFAKLNNDNILKFLSLLIITFIFAIIAILYIIYYDKIQIQYVILLPILIFMVVLSIILIDKIDGNNFGKDDTEEKSGSSFLWSIILNIIVFFMVGLVSISFLL